ncbi:hypothetical protein GW17_00047729 [Ensete ventricosum]|nr:hypothetical protein GW17_00047729 [Ensete ventricosum]
MAWGWCRLKSYSTHAPTELGTEQLPLVPCARFKISGVGSYDKGWRSHSFIVYESEDWASRWWAVDKQATVVGLGFLLSPIYRGL